MKVSVKIYMLTSYTTWRHFPLFTHFGPGECRFLLGMTQYNFGSITGDTHALFDPRTNKTEGNNEKFLSLNLVLPRHHYQPKTKWPDTFKHLKSSFIRESQPLNLFIPYT